MIDFSACTHLREGARLVYPDVTSSAIPGPPPGAAARIYPYPTRATANFVNPHFVGWLSSRHPDLWAEVREYWYPPVTPALIADQVYKYDGPDLPRPPTVAADVADALVWEDFTSLGRVEPLGSIYEVRLPPRSFAGFPSCLWTATRRVAAAYCTGAAAFADALASGVATHVWCLLGRAAVQRCDVPVKNRLIVAPDTAFHLTTMRFMQPLNDLWTDNHAALPIGVGSSIFRGGLDATLAYLRPPGEPEPRLYFACDVSRWDGTMWGFLFDLIARIRLACLQTHQTREGAHWWRALVMNAYAHVKVGDFLTPSGQVIQRTHGMPSGWGGTAHDNSIGHVWVIRYIIASLLQRLSDSSTACAAAVARHGGLLAATRTMRCKAMGDDLMFSIPLSLAAFITVADVMAEYVALGMHVKAGSVARSTDVVDLPWCSRFPTRLENGLLVPWRSTISTLTRLAYPKAPVSAGAEGLALTGGAAASHYLEAYCNPRTRDLLEEFINDCGLHDIELRFSSDVLRKLAVRGTTPPTRFPTRAFAACLMTGLPESEALAVTARQTGEGRAAPAAAA